MSKKTLLLFVLVASSCGQTSAPKTQDDLFKEYFSGTVTLKNAEWEETDRKGDKHKYVQVFTYSYDSDENIISLTVKQNWTRKNLSSSDKNKSTDYFVYISVTAFYPGKLREGVIVGKQTRRNDLHPGFDYDLDNKYESLEVSDDLKITVSGVGYATIPYTLITFANEAVKLLNSRASEYGLTKQYLFGVGVESEAAQS